MLVPDDILRYLPFAALSDAKQYLIEHYALAIHTEVAIGAIDVKPKVGQWQVDAFGVSQAWPNHKALPAVPLEMDSVKQALGISVAASSSIRPLPNYRYWMPSREMANPG